MFAPDRKHIMSPLQSQQVNAIHRFVMLYYCNHKHFGHYRSSCLLFKTRHFGDWIYIRLQVESTYMGPI
jgi:hypothetical protein